MSIGAYAKYRDSGTEWLGQIPAHWSAAALKRGFKIVGGSTPKSDDDQFWDGDIPWVTPADLSKLSSRYIHGTLRTLTREGLESCSASLVPLGSVILSTRAPIGSLGITGTGACTNQGCKALVPLEGSNSNFLAYTLSVATEQLNVRGKGTTFLELSADELGAFKVPFAPLAEQSAIAAFLDRETGKIDALVEEQRRLIELLKEKRQAVISHAVTKGLDPAAPMKDSGVEWLGEVPAHWAVKRLKQISSSYCDGPFGSGLKSEHYVNDGVRVIRLQNIRNGTFEGEDTAFISKDYFDRELTRHDVQGNDVLVAGLGDDRNAVGRACVAPADVAPAMVKADCFRFRLRSDSSPDFVAHQLSAGAIFAAGTLSSGSTRLRIPLSVMAGRLVAIPSVEEQLRIAREVAKRIAGFESLISEAEKGIALLRERRAALISAAVTGKIEVRGWTDADVRKAVTAEIFYLNARDRTFGRVKNQKLIYLAEAHAGIHEIGGRYERHAAGPYDGELMAFVERELVGAGVVTVRQDTRGAAVEYALAQGWKPDRERLRAMLGDRLAAFEQVNENLADLDTRAAEAVATLYAVWNDALIDGETCDEARVIRGFLDEWHPEKREKFREAELREWLGWMRRNRLTPQGRGPKTAAESLFK